MNFNQMLSYLYALIERHHLKRKEAITRTAKKFNLQRRSFYQQLVNWENKILLKQSSKSIEERLRTPEHRWQPD